MYFPERPALRCLWLACIRKASPPMEGFVNLACSRSWLVMGESGLNGIHFRWCKSKLENRASYYTRERGAMGNNKNQATLISFEQLNIYRSLFPVILRPPSASPGPALKPPRQKQQNAAWRETKKAVMLFKEWIKYSFQTLDFFFYWNVRLDNWEENSPCLKNSDVSLVISMYIRCGLFLNITDVTESHLNFSLPRLDHKGNHSFFLIGV